MSCALPVRKQMSAAQSGIIRYKENEVHCLRIGRGKKLLIAFHGFGNDASIFIPLGEALAKEYTTVAIDLPGHGQTRWKDAFFEKSGLMAIVQGIRNEFGVGKFSLAGYSLGGRAALCVAELQASWIDKMVLLAPDGLEKNFWYSFATRNPAGKILFRSMMKQPEKWLRRVDILRRYKLIDESRFRFARTQLSDEKVRHRLSYVWPVTSRLIVGLPIVRFNLKKQKTELHLFMGRHDRIFPPAQGERFVRGLKNARLHVLESGHQLLTPALLPEVAAVFQTPEPGQP